MDPQLEELYGPLHRMKFNDQAGTVLASQNYVNLLKLQDSNSIQGSVTRSFVNPPFLPTNLNFNLGVQSVATETVLDHHEDYDFSDLVLKYISQVLMEEDEEEKIRQYHEPSALEATEKSLYEALGKKYDCPSSQISMCYPNLACDSMNGVGPANHRSYSMTSVSSSSGLGEHVWRGDFYQYEPQNIVGLGVPSDYSFQTTYSSSNSSGRVVEVLQSNSDSSFGSSSSVSGLVNGLVDSPVSALSVSDIFNDHRSMLQFRKGIEEASKFLPNGSLYGGLKKPGNAIVKSESGYEIDYTAVASNGKKHRYPEDLQSEEGRGNKQSAVSDETIVRSEMFDMVLLCSGGKNEAAIREALHSEANKNIQNSQPKGTNGGRGRGRRHGGKRDVIDLRTLLSLCAQAVASNDQRSTNDLLTQIRQHSSPHGDGNQRMAHYFADGLEARLAGIGTPIYRCLVTGPASAVDILRAYHMFLATCPFKKFSNFYSNRTIMAEAENAKKVHIIDFGIVYGFQWPCLIQRLSSRPGGPPKLRITGVDFPQPGFRPAKRIEETGRRLANYAESFNVPFEFNAVAKKWEMVSIKDLKIDSDEVLIVNCMYRLKLIPDETVMVECPRDIVLNLIRELKPNVFIHGVVNGAYNSPFFITRFREALFHFSTLFDMLETVLPRDIQERVLIEREIFGWQAMNVVACEGFERIDRPETYKQWQVRNERAGFRQLNLNRELVDIAKERLKSVYHRDFSIDEDGQWLLQGWKGRIVYGLSTWKPTDITNGARS